MSEIALHLKCSVKAEVRRDFAFRYRTDVAMWDDPPARFVLNEPFETGAWGATLLPGQEPLRWSVASVTPGEAFVIEMPLDRALLTFEWRFEEVAERLTRMTQEIVLSGENAPAYAAQVAAAFGPNLEEGMRRIAAAMSAAQQNPQQSHPAV